MGVYIFLVSSIIISAISIVAIDGYKNVSVMPRGCCSVQDSISKITSTGVIFENVTVILSTTFPENLSVILQYPPPPLILNLKPKKELVDFADEMAKKTNIDCFVDLNNMIVYKDPIMVIKYIVALVISFIVMVICIIIIIWKRVNVKKEQ